MAIMAQTEIHSTAIVGPDVELGADIVVGPYCVLEGPLRLGDGCRLQSHVVINGPTEIGSRNHFYPFCSIGQQSQDLKYSAEPTHLIIGDDNTFREGVTVNRATNPGDATRIGSHGNFLAYSHIAHDCTVGDHVIFSNNGTLAGHVVVEDRAVIGGLSAVHQFCRVGQFAIIGGCAKIVQDVPPFMIVDGNPAKVRGLNSVGLGRANTDDSDIEALKKAFKLLFRSEQNFTQAVSSLRISDVAGCAKVDYLVNFLMASQRGVCR
ncbi:MAG: UDP-N-acetylglucosamine acyltransferase [Verrucomicrobiales bacterium]|jgi:UDP-N-acetylglucosamine acyltransferase